MVSDDGVREQGDQNWERRPRPEANNPARVRTV